MRVQVRPIPSGMILDHLSHADFYKPLSSRFAAGFEFLKNLDFEVLQPGRNDLSDGLFAMRQEYDTRLRADGVWEAHRKYADIQFVAGGAELCGCTSLSRATVSKAYDEAADYALFTGEGAFFELREGHFALFLPQDLHMPCIAIDETPAKVRKVVVKVPLD